MAELLKKKVTGLTDLSKSDILKDKLKRPEEATRTFLFGVKRSQWFFSGILVLSGLAGWVLLYLGLYTNVGGVQIWAYIILSLFVLSTGIGLSYYILHPRRLSILTYSINSFFAFAIFGWRGWEAVAVLVFFLATVWGYSVVKREQKIIIPFLYSRLLHRGLPIFFTGLAVAFSIFFNESPLGESIGRPKVPEQIISIAMIPVEYAIKGAVPEFDKDMKIADVEKLTMRQFPQFFEGPPQFINSSIQDFFSRIDAESRDKTVVEFLDETINVHIDAILLPYEEFLSFIFLFGLFLAFKALGVPIMWLSIGAGWVISSILLNLGILHVRKIIVEKEELIL